MRKPVRILIAEDDDRDFQAMTLALHDSRVPADLLRVRDGLEATQYLKGESPFGDPLLHRFPDIVILDLKMPRMDGFQFLAWIAAHPQHRVVPTIVMSSSALPSDVTRAYELGAHTYFVKQVGFNASVELFRTIGNYWSSATTPGSVARRSEQPA